MPYKDPEVSKQKQKEWYEKNKERLDSAARERYRSNPNAWKDTDWNWIKSNSDDIERRRQIARNSYHKHAEKICKKNRDKTAANQVNGVCPICGKEKRLVWDHCHVKNEFRDYICHNCNLLLGHSFDNIETLGRAIEYLNKHS